MNWEQVYWLSIAVVALMMTFAAKGADPRCCWDVPIRDMRDGSIYRDMSAVAEFRKMHPCPVDGSQRGPCRGWSVDHVIPLAVGGCDTPLNMQWLPLEIKSCAGAFCKDRFERKVYSCKEEW